MNDINIEPIGLGNTRILIDYVEKSSGHSNNLLFHTHMSLFSLSALFMVFSVTYTICEGPKLDG